MYRTCLHCHGDLGRNDVIEPLPIGRRLAFDQTRGRLWVVCRRCERWNLTPFEDRWEAIEECERQYRATPRRFATDQIGLARVREGLELVRIGAPLRPEFAAWRYGDQFGHRRRRAIAIGVGGIAVTVAIGASSFVLGIAGTLLSFGDSVRQLVSLRRRVGTIDIAGRAVALTRAQIASAAFDSDSTANHPVLQIPSQVSGLLIPSANGPFHVVQGPAAIAAARTLLPIINAEGGNAKDVATAADRLDRTDGTSAGDDGRFGQIALDAARRRYGRRLADLPNDLRLALEMAAQEDSERVWLAGELLDLEAEWRRAEELAAIADQLTAAPLDRQLDDLKNRKETR